MNDNEKIVIAIEMDDGSIKQGFINIEKKAKESGEKINKEGEKVKFVDMGAISNEIQSATPSVISNFGKMGLAAGGLAAAAYGIKAAFSLALKGEEVIAINAEFKAMAESAGLLPEALRGKLEEATRGMADFEDILKATSSAINSLGENANKLPELLDLARQAAHVTGNDITKVYSDMVRAVESGNTRVLRQYSLFIDSKNALNDYAKSLGLAASDLNQMQIQQAILNSTLEAGQKRFKGLDEDITPATNSMKMMREALNDIVDNIAVSVAESGPMVKFANLLKEIAAFKGPPKSSATEDVLDLMMLKAKAESDIAELRKNMTAMNMQYNKGVISDRLKEISELDAKIKASGAVIKENTATSVAAAKAKQSAEESAKTSIVATMDAQQVALVAYRNGMIERAQLAQDLSKTQSGQNEIKLMEDLGARRLATFANIQEQERLMTEAFENEKEMLRQQRAAGQIATLQEYKAQLIAIETNYQNQLSAIELQRQQNQQDPMAMANSFMTGSEAVLDGFRQSLLGAKGAAIDFANNASKNFKALGAQMFNSIGNAAGSAFAAFGHAIATGENALEAFANSLLASMGQMAVQLGTQFIMQGTAYMWAGMSNGGPLIAAGAALAAFGGLLSGLGGQSAPQASTSSVSSTGGGVATDGTSETVQVISPDKLEREKPQTHVNLTIEGDVFDSEETGLRIADIMNSIYSKQGVRLIGAT